MTRQYNRLNEDYRQLHQFCRLFLEGASISEESGPFDFQTFLVDMDRLFENFVTQVLRERAQDHATVDTQAPVYLGQEQKILMRPDILVSRDGAIVLVADCKYKRLEPNEFKNHDMYQMLAYCTAIRAQRGLLIYPLHSAVIQEEVEIRNTEIVLQRVTVDLTAKEVGELARKCEAFADKILSLI